jgi:hypothetical protein
LSGRRSQEAITPRPEQALKASSNTLPSNAFSDLTALGNALQTDDLKGAQDAFASFMRELGVHNGSAVARPAKAFVSMIQSFQNTGTSVDSGTASVIDTVV